MDVTIVNKDGRDWVKVRDLSPTMLPTSPSRKDKGLAGAVCLWIKRHIPPQGVSRFYSGVDKEGGVGRWQQRPGSGMAIHIDVTYLPKLLAYVRLREATTKDRMVLTYAYANMQKEAH